MRLNKKWLVPLILVVLLTAVVAGRFVAQPANARYRLDKTLELDMAVYPMAAQVLTTQDAEGKITVTLLSSSEDFTPSDSESAGQARTAPKQYQGEVILDAYLLPNPNEPAAAYSLSDAQSVPVSPFHADTEKIVIEESFRRYQPVTLAGWFAGLTKLESVTGFENMDTSEVTDMSGMFSGCEALTDVNLSGVNTEKVVNMSHMFADCVSLTELKLGSLNTSEVIDMSGMFSGCAALQELDISMMNTGKAENMSEMFSGCSGLKELNLSTVNFESAVDLSGMFADCSGLTSLHFNDANTKNVTDLSKLFYGCSSLRTIGLQSLDTEAVTNMSGMFFGCAELTGLELTGFDTENVGDMSYLFYGCKNLKHLDLSSFDTGYAADFTGMFSGCESIEDIAVAENFKLKDGAYYARMYEGCENLVGGGGMTYPLFLEMEEVRENSYFMLTYSGEDAVSVAYNLNDNGCENEAFEQVTWPGFAVRIGGDGDQIEMPARVGYVFDGWNTAADGSGMHVEHGEILELEEHSLTLFAQWREIAAKAVSVTENNTTSLVFLYGAEQYHVGGSFNGGTITNVLELKNRPTREEIALLLEAREVETDPEIIADLDAKLKVIGLDCAAEKVVFDESFKQYTAESTVGWFFGCTELVSVQGLENLNAAHIVSMDYMFYGCEALPELDLTELSFEDLQTVDGFVYGCTSLQRIFVFQKTGFHPISGKDMFGECIGLIGGVGTVFTYEHTGLEYAQIDSAEVHGYFTDPIAYEEWMRLQELETAETQELETPEIQEIEAEFVHSPDSTSQENMTTEENPNEMEAISTMPAATVEADQAEVHDQQEMPQTGFTEELGSPEEGEMEIIVSEEEKEFGNIEDMGQEAQ